MREAASRRFHHALQLAAIFCVVAKAGSATPAPALTPDPDLAQLTLPNGFRIAALRHPEPVGRVSFHLVVRAGSYDERDYERGVAHFVEHLVFRSSRDFPGNNAVETLQKMGLAFGADANATTSEFETDYRLDNIDAANASSRATAELLLRAFADGALFRDKDVDSERKVVLAEFQYRHGLSGGLWDSRVQFIPAMAGMPPPVQLDAAFGSNSRLSTQANALGSADVVRRALPELLRNFYDRWYRPDRMVLAAVGDIKPAELSRELAAVFAPVRARGLPPAEPPAPAALGESRHRIEFQVSLDPHMSRERVSIQSVVPALAGDATAQAKEDFSARMAMFLLDRRLGRSTAVAGDSSSECSEFVPGWRLYSASALVREADAPAAMQAMWQILANARKFPVGPGELDQIKRQVGAYLDRVVEEGRSMPAAQLAAECAFAVERGVLIADPVRERDLARVWLKEISAEQISAALQRAWPDRTRTFIFVGPSLPRHGVTDHLGNVLSQTVPYAEPDVKSASTDWFWTPPPGRQGVVVEKAAVKGVDAWVVKFANGVRLNFKALATVPNHVAFQMNFGSGFFGQPPGHEGLAIGMMAVPYGGLRSMDMGQMSDAILGRVDGFAFGVYGDRFDLAEQSLPADELPRQLSLMADFLMEPGFRPSAEVRMRAQLQGNYLPREHMAVSRAQSAVNAVMIGPAYPNDVGIWTQSQGITFDQWKAAIEPQLLHSPLEITVVGDITLGQAIDAVARTLGTMPDRPLEGGIETRRRVQPAPLPHSEILRFNGNPETASAFEAWPLRWSTKPRDLAAADLLRGVLQDRLRVRLRVEMGATYSPEVASLGFSDVRPPRLILVCHAESKPGSVKKVARAIREVVADFVAHGVSAEELERARQPALAGTALAQRDNGYWVQALASLQSYPEAVPALNDMPAALAAAPPGDVDALARQSLTDDRRCEVIAIPR